MSNTPERTPGPASARQDPTQSPAEAAPSPIADPAPLGLGAFALTTFTLSLFNAGWVAESLEPVVLPLALFYGGLAQVIAGVWEFRNHNTFGATAFCSFGAFWLAFAALVQFIEPQLQAQGATETQLNTAVGVFLIGWAVFTGYMLIASLRTTGALVGVFATLFLTFVFLAVGDLTGVDPIATIGGYLGIVTALVAWYASFAIVTNKTWGRSTLPVAPRS